MIDRCLQSDRGQHLRRIVLSPRGDGLAVRLAAIKLRLDVSSEGSSQAPYLPGRLKGKGTLAPAFALQKRLSSIWLFLLIARYLMANKLPVHVCPDAGNIVPGILSTRQLQNSGMGTAWTSLDDPHDADRYHITPALHGRP